MWIGWTGFMVLLQTTLVQAAETGNSLVTCAACQTLQAQIDNWSCEINCRVANGNNDDLVTFGIINQLIETVKQFNETVKKQAEMVQNQAEIIQKQAARIEKLEATTCAFSARGPDSEMIMSVNATTVLVFENVDLNVCGGYDNTTGIFTPTVNGTYLLSTQIKGGSNTAYILIKRNADTICTAWVISVYAATTSCTVTVRLTAGDSIKVTGGSEPGKIRRDVQHFTGYLIRAD